MERRLAEGWGVPVVDRFSVILRIFQARATTQAAGRQLELARLRYKRARLVDPDASRSQQRGATSKLSGPGETQLERSRRVIDARIGALSRQLAAEARARASRRRARRGRDEGAACRVPVVCLVGYTNAGKSALHARLAQAGDAGRARDASFHQPRDAAPRLRRDPPEIARD